MDTSQQHNHAPTPHPGFPRRAAIRRYEFMRVRMEFGRNNIYIFFYGRSKVENGRTKLIVLGQIVHALFISNYILWVLTMEIVDNFVRFGMPYSRNANMYRAESLVSFVRKHDVIKIGQKQKGNVCALFNQLRFNARCVYY